MMRQRMVGAVGWVARSRVAAAVLVASTVMGCGGGDDGAGAAGAGGAAGGAGGRTSQDKGQLEVQAHWGGSVPEATELKVALFECPFSMPPKRVFSGKVDVASGRATARDDAAPVGHWCLMAYYDLDPGDGLAPVQGLDPVNATGKENDKGAVPIDIEGGKTTTVTLELDVRQSQ